MADKKLSHTTAVITMVRSLIADHRAELFHDASGAGYLYAPVFAEPDHIAYFETMLLQSDACRSYLRRQYYNASGKTLTGSALHDAIETLAGSASAGPCRPTYVRIASFADRVLLDLVAEDRSVVMVTCDGWTIGPCPSDIRFVRRRGMLPAPLPLRSEVSLFDMIPQVLNIADQTSVRLLLAWWIVALRGRGPFLVLVIRGGSGTAKSNALLVIRCVIDPNEAMLNHLPRDQRDLVISVANCYVASFDNLSHLPEDIADGICVLATGGGLRTRKLHTDSEEAIFSKKAPVVLNGIPDLLGRSDLGARSVVVELQPISDEQRKTEGEITLIKDEILPRLLGRLLDVLVSVLRWEPTTRPVRLPRMADAAVTLTAAEEALGLESGTYIALLNQQTDAVADAVLETSAADVVAGLQKVMLEDGVTPAGWEGELKTLLGLMESHDEYGKPWTAKKLGNALRRFSDVLPRAGFQVIPPAGQQKNGPHRDKRIWRVVLVPSEFHLQAEGADGTRGTRQSRTPNSEVGVKGKSGRALETDTSHVSTRPFPEPF